MDFSNRTIDFPRERNSSQYSRPSALFSQLNKSARNASMMEMVSNGRDTISEIRRQIAKESLAKPQKTLTYEKNFNLWRDLDLLTSLIAILGLVLSLIDYSYSNNRVLVAFEGQTIVSNPFLAKDEVQLRLNLA